MEEDEEEPDWEEETPPLGSSGLSCGAKRRMGGKPVDPSVFGRRAKWVWMRGAESGASCKPAGAPAPVDAAPRRGKRVGDEDPLAAANRARCSLRSRSSSASALA